MQALILPLVCLLGLSAAKFAPLSDEQINYINSVQTSWKAGRNFEQKDYGHVKSLLGVDWKRNALFKEKNPLPVVSRPANDDVLPENFDARNTWPDCWSMKEVRDQGECGSCWAFGAAEAMSDRIYVATGENVRISSEDILACCGTYCGSGCGGGIPSAAWNWFVTDGVVTGGHYESYRGCMPYTLPPCDHHVDGDHHRNCSQYSRPTPKCHNACIDEYDLSYPVDKHFGSKAFYIDGSNVENIMSEIYNYGPVTAGFDVYEDFLSYQSGVYVHTTGEYEGGHAIKIIGWGVEDGQDYWLVTNSWNRDWGDDGLFKIAKGTNECGIESDVVAGYIAV